MAILKGPLMSLQARGKIADTLVFMGWKGLKTVRAYVVPANPDTAAQQAQRAFMTAGVGQYHNANLTGSDKEAWDLYANTLGKPMAGFNAFTKNYIDIAVAGKTYNLLWDLAGSVAVATKLTVSVEGVAEDLTGNVHYGIKPNALIHTAAIAHDAGGKYTCLIEDLTGGVTYYYTVILTLEAKLGNRTGIQSALVTAV